jgi:hypothetical protein
MRVGFAGFEMGPLQQEEGSDHCWLQVVLSSHLTENNNTVLE